VALASACGTSASFDDCTITCEVSTARCPDGLTCRASGFCVAEASGDTCAAVPDGPRLPDGALDAPLCDTPAECLDTGFVFTCPGSLHCYSACPTYTTQMSALASCQEWSGTLVIIDTAGEDGCLTSMVGPLSVWIDLHQGDTATTPGDGWSWSEGDWGYRNWGSEEPNDEDTLEDGTEQCAIVEALDGAWADAPCDSPFPFVCER
jgi:hypothetical protein